MIVLIIIVCQRHEIMEHGHHHFHGKDIPHIKINSKTSIEDLVDIFSSTGYNARQLGDAAKLWAKMIEEDAVICLTIAGAMTPVGFGGIDRKSTRLNSSH